MTNITLTTKFKTIKLYLFWCLLFFGGQLHAQTWQVVWEDQFTGNTLNTANWNIEVNDLGGGNNELQYYTNRSENIRVENDVLVIEARKENYLTRNYTSGRLNSKNKKSWKYGKIEAKMKLPYGNGMWPAFWAMGNSGNWPACGEIDIMELVGGNKCGFDCGDNKTHGYMWWSDGGDKSSGTIAPTLASGKYADDYHLFAVEWDETSIKWMIDDKIFHTENVTGAGKTEFHQNFYLLLNIAVGGDWPGSPDASTVFPQRMYVDYVRVYQKSNCVLPAQPGAISGNTSVAPGSSQTYSVAAVSGATSYTWTLPSGWSGSSTSTSITTTAGAAGGTISVKANNACGSSVARTLAVSISCPLPAQPGVISGNTSVAPGSSQTYSIAAVSAATSYSWTLPSGWSGSSSSTSITTTAGAAGGTISVRANNSCGSSAASTLSVTINCPLPAQPGAISGNTSVAPGSSQTYSIATVSGATSYSWTLPSGWSGSLNTTTTSITVTAGTAGGTISVRANNSCGSSAASTLAVSVINSGTQSPYGGTAWAIPGTVEAENYDLGGQGIAFNETTTANQGGAYRTDAIDIEAVSGGGYNVGWIVTDEWLEYTVNVTTAGSYKIDARVATTAAGKTFRLELDGATLGNFTLPNTTGWQIWQTVSLSGINLTAGQKVLRVYATSTDFNLDKLVFTNVVVPSQTPYGGTAWAIPGTVEAENYDLGGQGVAFNETTAANQGGAYRTDAVDLEINPAGGYNLGYIVAGEWTEYTVNVTSAGTYTIDARVAAITTGKYFRLELDGALIATVNVPNTGAWQTWQSAVISNVNLSAGTKVLRIYGSTTDFNVDKISFIKVGSIAAADALPQPEINNAPNPFYELTSFTLDVTQAGNVSVKIYDKTGAVVATVFEGYLEAGIFEYTLDATRLRPDVYYVRFVSAGGVVTKTVTKL